MSNDCTVEEAIAKKEELRASIQRLCNEYTKKTGVVISVDASQQPIRLGHSFSGYYVGIEVVGLFEERAW